jgi:imidazolonepropionase-like amidohydrolase
LAELAKVPVGSQVLGEASVREFVGQGNAIRARLCCGDGAEFLGQSARIGTIAQGKQADLVVVDGDPSARIADIRNVEIIFRKGVGYSSKKLFGAVRGLVGVQ